MVVSYHPHSNKRMNGVKNAPHIFTSYAGRSAKLLHDLYIGNQFLRYRMFIMKTLIFSSILIWTAIASLWGQGSKAIAATDPGGNTESRLFVYSKGKDKRLAALASDLDFLTKRASVAAKTVPNHGTENFLIKYYSGVNHPHHGLLENGVGEFSSRPASGSFTEHCFDKDGKLVKSIGNLKDGTRFVSRTFLYEGDHPVGMLTFCPSGHSFSDVGLYREGRLSVIARIAPSGNVMSCECIFHTGDREDCSVRYVSSRTNIKFTVSDLNLDAIYLHGGSLLPFNAIRGDSNNSSGAIIYYPKGGKKIAEQE
jgi:hypothetical protein